jgi:hypothetical protein
MVLFKSVVSMASQYETATRSLVEQVPGGARMNLVHGSYVQMTRPGDGYRFMWVARRAVVTRCRHTFASLYLRRFWSFWPENSRFGTSEMSTCSLSEWRDSHSTSSLSDRSKCRCGALRLRVLVCVQYRVLACAPSRRGSDASVR